MCTLEVDVHRREEGNTNSLEVVLWIAFKVQQLMCSSHVIPPAKMESSNVLLRLISSVKPYGLGIRTQAFGMQVHRLRSSCVCLKNRTCQRTKNANCGPL